MSAYANFPWGCEWCDEAITFEKLTSFDPGNDMKNLCDNCAQYPTWQELIMRKTDAFINRLYAILERKKMEMN